VTVDLDHVALAADDVAAALGGLVGELGGRWLEGGDGVGFRWVQVRLGDHTVGMTVEVITPWRPERHDFLARFLARHGEGPHHLTFKVPDLPAMLDRAHIAGFTPVGVNLDDPAWREAFLLPREAHGTVVQLAEVGVALPSLADRLTAAAATGGVGEPRWWPAVPAGAARRSVLARVVLQTTSLPAALGLFAGLLGGEPVAEDAGMAELAWPGGGRILLVDAAGVPGVVELHCEDLPAPQRVAGTTFSPVRGAQVLDRR
jgi:catechol 2,3-dioxygenase-like lactoylglutathione lyase family enzyme